MTTNDPDHDWVEAASCTWLHEAAVLRSVLDAAGIEALIPNEQTLGVQPLYGNLVGGVRILVQPGDLDRARELLASAAVRPDPGNRDDMET
jgi:hypothetical protein